MWSTRPLDLWQYFSGDEAENRRLMEQGRLPWFSLPRLKEACWRPLSSAILAFEHTVFGRRALGYHLMQMFWFLALTAATGLLMKRVLPTSVGALALLLFVVDDGHWDMVCLTCRSHMVAMVPALLALWAYVRWRRDGWRPGLALSLAGIGVGLLGGENAIQVVGYFIAYEVFASTDAWASRFRSLMPLGLLLAGYLILYRLLDRGAFGRSGYLDPFEEPRAFLSRSGFMLLTHLANLFTAWPRYLFQRFPLGLSLSPLLFGLLAVLTGAFLWLLVRAIRALPEEEARTVRWMVAGAVLSIIPGVAGPLVDRGILVASVGGAVATAAVLRYTWTVRRKAIWAACALTTVTHVVLAPIALPLMHRGVRASGDEGRKVLAEAEVGSARDVLILVARNGSMMTDTWGGWVRRFETGREVSHWWVLTHRELDDQELLRTGVDSFELATKSQRVPYVGFETIYRDPRRFPFRVGDEVAMEGMQVRVLEVKEGFATRIAVRMDRPLDDPSLAILTTSTSGSLVRVSLPGVGERLELPARFKPIEAPAESSSRFIRALVPRSITADPRLSATPTIIP